MKKYLASAIFSGLVLAMPLSVLAHSASAQEGQFCGGIAGKVCPAGYTCKLDGDFSDAGGKCVKNNSEVNLKPRTTFVGPPEKEVNKNVDRKEEVKEKRDGKKAELKEKKEEKKEQESKEKDRKSLAELGRKLREDEKQLENVAKRLDKAETNGKDVVALRAKLDAVKKLITEAGTALKDKTLTVKEIRAKVQAVHRALVDVNDSIKGLGNGKERPKPSVSPSASPTSSPSPTV